MSLLTADSSADSNPRQTVLGAPAQDWRFLGLAVIGALLFHFGWTVPWGPFEESSRNRVRSHEAFAALLERYKERSFESEPNHKELAHALAFDVQRAVQLARTRLISKGHRHWLVVADLACHSTRCRFSVCESPDFPDKSPEKGEQGPPTQIEGPLQRALEAFELGRRPAWALERIPSPGCPRFEVRFLQLPRKGCLMTLRETL